MRSRTVKLGRRALILPLAFITFFALTAESCDNAPANSAEQSQQSQIQTQLNQSQPIPQFKWSQYRQTLISIETAQAHTIQTTTFEFNLGVTDPIASCPSIGF